MHIIGCYLYNQPMDPSNIMANLRAELKRVLQKNPQEAFASLKHAFKKPLRRIKRRVLLEFGRPESFGKTDLIYFVSKKLHLRNYLELCTPISGGKYWDIHRWRFDAVRRLMYNCDCPYNYYNDGARQKEDVITVQKYSEHLRSANNSNAVIRFSQHCQGLLQSSAGRISEKCVIVLWITCY